MLLRRKVVQNRCEALDTFVEISRSLNSHAKGGPVEGNEGRRLTEWWKWKWEQVGRKRCTLEMGWQLGGLPVDCDESLITVQQKAVRGRKHG